MAALLLENGEWRAWRSLVPIASCELRAQRSLERLNKKIRLALGLRAEPFSFRNGTNGLEVRVSGVAGTLSAEDFVLDIAPKFVPQGDAPEWNASMLLLMRHARRRHVAFSPSKKLAAVRHSFVDLLAMAFLDAVNAGLADQPIQVYRSSPESLPVIRGRLNIPRQMRSMFMRPHLVECDVDQLDADNDFNGLLKWAARTFSASVRSPILSRAMTDLAQRMPGSANRKMALHGSRLVPPPQFRVWQEALEIAGLLSSGLSHTTGRGDQHGYSFLFNMERLFEHFVEVRLRRAVSLMGLQGIEVHPQVSTLYAEPGVGTTGKFYSKPDNVVFREGKPFIIVDAKYKRLSDAEGLRVRKPVNADLYELVAAMTAQKCSAGLLVYPRVSGDAVLTDHHLKTWTVSAFGAKLQMGAIAIELSNLIDTTDLDRVDQTLMDALHALARLAGLTQ